MNQLPQEIINLVASFIDSHPDPPSTGRPSNLSPYATISPLWKLAIERTVFREITLKSTELETFDAIFKGDRRRWLMKLTLDVILPTYDDKACGRFERAADKNANDEAFTQAIEKLLAVLKSWEDASVEGSICVVLGGIYSPSDPSQRDFETLQQQRFEAEVGKRHDIFEYRYKHSMLHLLRPDRLPSLHRITMLNLGNGCDARSLEMRAVVDMATNIPSLNSAGWQLYDNEKLYPKLRRANRHSFACVLSACTFPSLRTAELTFYHEAPLNQKTKPADLLGDDHPCCDPLSTALRRVFSQSQNLTSLTLTGVFDSSLFWPCFHRQSSNTPVSSWPKLKAFTVTFDITTPSGHWYFTDPSGSDPEDKPTLPAEYADLDSSSSYDDAVLDWFEIDDARLSSDTFINAFRTVPNPAHVNPLVLGFAKSLQHMPSILSATLTTGPVDGPDGTFQFEICYYAPHQTAYYGDEGVDDQKSPRLYMEVGNWRPDEEVWRALREAGRSRWGGGLVERFLESQC